MKSYCLFNTMAEKSDFDILKKQECKYVPTKCNNTKARQSKPTVSSIISCKIMHLGLGHAKYLSFLQLNIIVNINFNETICPQLSDVTLILQLNIIVNINFNKTICAQLSDVILIQSD